MREITLKEPVELRLPAQQSMMLVLRLTTAGVIARAGLTVDRMDDVKMAVEEAANCLIAEGGGPRRLCLSFEETSEQFTIRVRGEGAGEGGRMSADERCVVRCILESLVDGVEMEMHGDAIGAIALRVAPAL